MKSCTKSIVLLVFLFFPLIVRAQASAQEKPGGRQASDTLQVFTELLRPYRDLNDYTARIHASVTMPTIRIPDFNAILYFKKPDRFHIETRSFAPIPRNSGMFNPFQFDPAKNRIAYERTENSGGTTMDVFRVEPMAGKSLIQHYTVWVGGNPRRIMQMESLSTKGTKGRVTLTYRIVEQGLEKWPMPEKIHIHLTFPEVMNNADTAFFSTRDNPVSSGMRRLDDVSGEGDIDIAYSEWRINAGLDDRLFKKPTPSPP
jgi:outer membrane lipoprotein-sorting protein